ncbi:MAG: hypothetical protein O6934_08625 [SAR324 cluster bacterium]|nr:hypothetical protein [SAR324 cluster bacterium]MCZ6646745.1 hypothetical protein [SAR324 cluster bacterium]MCZ6729234.1 hypothetical protein [SAR324 cluster bacterium]MCZ6841862.1 hypothetical protein [SAR324 cluster bacterium]
MPISLVRGKADLRFQGNELIRKVKRGQEGQIHRVAFLATVLQLRDGFPDPALHIPDVGFSAPAGNIELPSRNCNVVPGDR